MLASQPLPSSQPHHLYRHNHRMVTKRLSGLDSTPSSSILPVDSNGEFHDPGYTASLRNLKLQIEQQSSAAADRFYPPKQRSSDYQTFRRRSLQHSMLDQEDECIDHDRHAAESSSSFGFGDSDENLNIQPLRLHRGSSSLRQASRYPTPNSLCQTVGEQRRSISSWSHSTPEASSSRLVGGSAGDSALQRNNGSLRRAKSKRTPQASPRISAIDDWRTGFTGIVDIEASKSRRASADLSGISTPILQLSRPSSPASSSITTSSRDVTCPFGSNLVPLSSKRRSSEGSARFGLITSGDEHSRRLANFQDTLLRKGRSESDPSPPQRGHGDASPPADERDVGYSAETVAAKAPRLPARMEKTPGDLLTPLDENGGYRGEFFAPLDPLMEQSFGQATRETAADQEERQKSPRLPLLGRRPSPVEYHITRSSVAQAGDKPSRVQSPLADSFERDLRSMRRKMQNISLGVRIKAMRAEKSVKKRWSTAIGGDGEQSD